MLRNALLCGLCAFVLLSFGCTITGNITSSMVRDVKEPIFDYNTYFCPRDDCLGIIKTLIKTSEKADCAFYNIDSELVKDIKDKNVRLVVDSNSEINVSFIKKDSSSKLMHNKFCTINETIILTGSFNPTKRAVNDKNNIILIKSFYLAKNYGDEFEELWRGTFHKGRKTKYQELYLNNSLIKNYFCPEDNCAEKVIEEINNAKASVYFLAYSFTHKEIADSLLEKDKETEGIEVRGVFFSGGKYSQYERLRNRYPGIRLYNGKGLMHNKIFIIDNETVILGSFNPTKNGDLNNDENILIIKNKDIAHLYLKEFNDIYKQNK